MKMSKAMGKIKVIGTRNHVMTHPGQHLEGSISAVAWDGMALGELTGRESCWFCKYHMSSQSDWENETTHPIMTPNLTNEIVKRLVDIETIFS